MYVDYATNRFRAFEWSPEQDDSSLDTTYGPSTPEQPDAPGILSSSGWEPLPDTGYDSNAAPDTSVTETPTGAAYDQGFADRVRAMNGDVTQANVPVSAHTAVMEAEQRDADFVTPPTVSPDEPPPPIVTARGTSVVDTPIRVMPKPGEDKPSPAAPQAASLRPVTLTNPANARMDPTLSKPEFSFNSLTDPRQRRPGSEEAISSVLDLSANMYRAQREGSTVAPPVKVPDEEKAIIGSAIAALAKGKSTTPDAPLPDWASDVLYNAGRAAWQASRGRFDTDAKYADPVWVGRWVNSFLRGSTVLPLQRDLAEDIRRTGNPAPADLIAATKAPWIAKFGRDPVASTLTEPQTAATLSQYGVDPQLTYEVCGPIAASAMLKAATGDVKWTFGKTFNEARAGGFWGPAADGNGNDWKGPDQMARFLTERGAPAQVLNNANNPNTLKVLVQDIAQGKPVEISTNLHYFVLSDYNPETGQFYTGTTGDALKAGKRWMTADEIQATGKGGFTAVRLLNAPSAEASGDVVQTRTAATSDPRGNMPPSSARTTPHVGVPTMSAETQARLSPQFTVYKPAGVVDFSSHSSRNGVAEGEIESYARKRSVQNGIDPEQTMWVINNEGGTSNPVKQNNGGAPAYGPMQNHMAGLGAEFSRFMSQTYGLEASVKDPKWWKAALDFDLDTAARARNWNPWEAATVRGKQNDGFINPKPLGISDEALAYAGYNPRILQARARGLSATASA